MNEILSALRTERLRAEDTIRRADAAIRALTTEPATETQPTDGVVVRARVSRGSNTERVLGHLRDLGRSTTADMAEALGLTPLAVAGACAQLFARGLVERTLVRGRNTRGIRGVYAYTVKA